MHRHPDVTATHCTELVETRSRSCVSPTALTLIRDLVSFDTTSRLSNLVLIDFVREYLSRFDIDSELIFNDDKSKANLFATIGPSNRPGVMLSGHTDVVPVDGQDWDADPFSVHESSGRLYGRGTADMKSFIAIVLSCVPRMLERKIKIPVHLAFSYDEEVGCLGVRGLVEHLRNRRIQPKFCIVGEPTGMKVIHAHKGKHVIRVTVRGRECHSALGPNEGVNAIEFAAALITFIRSLALHSAAKGPFEEGYEVTYTTIQTGVIEGGSIVNIVPKECRFEFEIRNLPRENTGEFVDRIAAHATDVLEPQMHRIDPRTGFHFEEQSRYPGLQTSVEAEVVNFVQSLTEPSAVGKIAFGTEGGLFQAIGIPTVVCGPGHIAQAHKRNEYVDDEQLLHCERFMQRLIDWLAQ